MQDCQAQKTGWKSCGDNKDNLNLTLTRPSFINFCKERMQISREAPHTEKPDIPSKHDISVQFVNKMKEIQRIFNILSKGT